MDRGKNLPYNLSMIYAVKVKPGSKKGPLVVADDATAQPSAPSQPRDAHTQHQAPELTVYLREKPVDGEANRALVQLLADYFAVSKSQVVIKTGTHGRQKLVEILK